MTLFWMLLINIAWAQNSLSLADYLKQVSEQNPEAVARAQKVKAYEQRRELGEAAISPDFYVNYQQLDDRKPTLVPAFMGTRTKTSYWRSGIRDQTKFGLSADFYVDSMETNILGADPTFLTTSQYRDTRGVLELKQSLWRNGFGENTRSELKAARASNEAQMESEKFGLQRLMLDAESLYWALASYNEIVKLQEENVNRARKTRDWMRGRAKVRLYDDVDAMQTQASFEARELEYQTSLDERASLVRQFNTMRGMNSNKAENLETLPTDAWKKEFGDSNNSKISRADFRALRKSAEAVEAMAHSNRSKIRPQLDLVGQVATTGRDSQFSESWDRAQDFDHPTYMVGVNFSMGIDFGLLGDLRSSYEVERKAADNMVREAEFKQGRAWQDLLARKKEAIGLYDRALSLENLSQKIVQRERQRLMNGRTTTFQMLQQEQNLALTQVQRVKAQLNLLQTHNAIRMFGE